MKKSVSELYQSGKDLFDSGKYAEAEPILQEVIKLNPSYADVLNKLGVIAYLNSAYEEASEYFEQALRINPSYTEASLNLSITYNALGRFAEAQDVISLAAQIAHPTPSSLDPFAAGKLANEHYKVGNLYLDLGLYDEAIEEYNKALRLHPSASDILTKLGVALRYKGKYEDAVVHFLKAKETNPDYGQAWVQLGLTFYMKGLIGNAIEEWERALEHNPNLNEAKTYLKLIRKKEEE
ncbi:MAG TPA: tetratricopeptide repeat protein [Thermodesulfovibrionales bacterium]|nr:tetratricopeptide repeat protein [Thermodesulfovibrionales bacterium]